MDLVDRIEMIYSLLNREKLNDEDIGVLCGRASIALFNFKYADYFRSNDCYDVGLNVLEGSVNSINQGYNFPTYCAGIAGYGWLMSYLESEKYIEVDTNELFDTVDDYLFENMLQDLKIKEFDFLHGALGCAFYFLEQYKKKKDPKYEKYIITFLNGLQDSVLLSDRGASWLSHIDREENTRGYNLSLSHGIASIISVLTRMYHYECFRNIIGSLLRRSVDYVLSYKEHSNDSTSLFPNYITKEGEQVRSGRLAWCYGDLGIAIALWNFSLLDNDKDLKETVVEIVRFCAKRRKIEDTKVVDFSLCHGAFGNALIFQKFYAETKESGFLEAFQFWKEDGIRLLDESLLEMNSISKTEINTSLLDGLSGAGLSILSFLSGDYSWNRCLLIS